MNVVLGLMKRWLVLQGLDAALGAIGVGGNEIDLKKDAENWEKANLWEKSMSAVLRVLEGTADLIGLDSLANQGRADRIAAETKYLDSKFKVDYSNEARGQTTNIRPASNRPMQVTVISQLDGREVARNTTLYQERDAVKFNMLGNLAFDPTMSAVPVGLGK
jgi:hypothetical protein